MTRSRGIVNTVNRDKLTILQKKFVNLRLQLVLPACILTLILVNASTAKMAISMTNHYSNADVIAHLIRSLTITKNNAFQYHQHATATSIMTIYKENV